MDLELSDEQRMIVSTVRDFVRREIVPREAELDPDADELPRADFEALVGKVKGMGLYCADVPEELGGPGVDTVTFTLMSIPKRFRARLTPSRWHGWRRWKACAP